MSRPSNVQIHRIRRWTRLTAQSTSGLMAAVSDPLDNQDGPPAPTTSVALCIDGETLTRLGRIIRNLAVGMIDHAMSIQLVCPDPRIGELSFGPIRTVVHPPIVWPAATRRIARVLEMLGPPPPTVVHAMSTGSYELASAISEVFESDLVVQVTSLADCEGLDKIEEARVGAYLPFSEPLAQVMHDQLPASEAKTELIRPGVIASQNVTCFADESRTATILCTTDFDRRGGVECLIDAVSVLRGRGRELLVFLLGEGPLESNLRRRVRQRKLSSTVTFARPWGDPVDAMKSGDIFVRPADNGSYLINPLQAMGVGMAVVSYPCGVSDYLRNGDTAILCAGASPDSMADAIDRLLDDRTFARRLATTGRDFVRTYHPVSGMSDKTAGVYRRLALDHATFPIKE